MKLKKTREALDQAGFGGALHLRREALAEIEQWEELGVAALDVSDAETKGIHALSREIHILDRKLVPIVKGELFVEPPEEDDLESFADALLSEEDSVKLYVALNSVPDYSAPAPSFRSVHTTLEGAIKALYPKEEQERFRSMFTKSPYSENTWDGPDGFGTVKLIEVRL